MTDVQTTFTKEETHSHLAANFAFLPFVVNLLDQKPLTQGVYPLLMEKPNLLTLEAVEAVQDIANRACFAWLARQLGWRKRAFVSPHEDKPLEGRLWSPQIWQDLRLQFTDSSLMSLMCAYNFTRRVPKAAELKSGSLFGAKGERQLQDTSLRIVQMYGISAKTLEDLIVEGVSQSSKVLKTLPLERNGDILLNHLVFRRLQRETPLDRQVVNSFLRNPLNLITHFHLCHNIKAKSLDALQVLFQPHLEPLLPWLQVDWAKQWLSLEESRWTPPVRRQDPLENFRQFCHHQTLIFTEWFVQCEKRERPDLLLGMLEYYSKWVEKCGPIATWEMAFRQITSELRHVERTEYSDLWARAMMPALALRKAYEDARKLHPIDREAPHHLFMDAYQRCEFEKALAPIEQLLHSLQPSIG